MPSMGDLLDERLRGEGAIPTTERVRVTDVGFTIPDSHRSKVITEWAEHLSGTSNKKSKAYKTARRNLERWSPSPAARARGAKPRRVTTRLREKVATAIDDADATANALRGGAEMKLLISWYSSRKPEWVPPHYNLHIDGFVMDHVIDAWENGHSEDAGGELWFAFLRAYNVPNIEDWMENVELRELQMEPA